MKAAVFLLSCVGFFSAVALGLMIVTIVFPDTDPYSTMAQKALQDLQKNLEDEPKLSQKLQEHQEILNMIEENKCEMTKSILDLKKIIKQIKDKYGETFYFEATAPQTSPTPKKEDQQTPQTDKQKQHAAADNSQNK